MIRQSQPRSTALRIYISLILVIVINNSHIQAQYTKRVAPNVDSTLIKIMDTDQSLREKFNYTLANSGGNSPDFILASKDLNIGDSINQKQIDSIFHTYGWLAPPIVSEKASKAYFYVIQHAQYEFQKKYKPHVIQAFKKGVIDRQEFIFFIDRLAIREQKYQKHGTQIMTDNIGNNYFVPIDTTNNSANDFLEDIEQRMKNNDFILFANNDLITIFVHSFDINTNGPIPFLVICLDGEKIGETNKNGFFQTCITRKKGESILTVTDSNTKKTRSRKLNFQEDIDFFDSYFGFR